MGDIKLNSTGGGSVTLTPPSTASNLTLTLPSASGTVATTSGSGSVFTNPTINGFTGDTSVINVGSGQFYKDTSGNVGIGTSSPGVRLDVVGTTTSGIRLRSNSAAGNGFNIYNDSSTDIAYLTNYYSGAMVFGTANTERMRLDSSGNLGLGVTPSAWYTTTGYAAAQLGSSSIAARGNSVLVNSNGYTSTSGGGWKYINNDYATSYAQYSGQHVWFTAASGTAGNTISYTQAMTLDASGRLLVGTTSAYSGTNTFQTSVADRQAFVNSNASPYGIYLRYTGASPNGTGNEFVYCVDSGATVRASIRSNGGLANFSANNVNLSDERVKTDITPAPSYLDKINAIEVVNFKYKDQTHEDPNLGVIAQQVLSVAPELVDEDGFGETPEDGIPLMAIYETDLKYAMLKAIQELTAQNQKLEARLAQLEAK